MECTVSRSELLALAVRAASVAADKSPMLLLTKVVLTAADATLSAHATDLRLGVTASIDARTTRPGTLAVDARKLSEVVKSLPAGDVTLRCAGGGEPLEVRAGKSRIKLGCLDPADFPKLPTAEDAATVATLQGTELARLLVQGSHAMALDDKRPDLYAAMLEASAKALRVVSTDSARLGVAHASDAVVTGAVKALIPSPSVRELRKLAESAKDASVQLSHRGSHLFATSGRVTLSVTLLDSPYVPWDKVIPKSFAHVLTAPRQELLESVRRVALVAGKADCSVQLAFGQQSLRVRCATSSDSADDEVATDGDFEGLVIGAAPAYLVAALEVIVDDDVRIELGGELDPIVLTGAASGDCKCVVMPRRK